MWKVYYKPSGSQEPVLLELKRVGDGDSLQYHVRCRSIDDEFEMTLTDGQGWWRSHGKVIHFHAVTTCGGVEVWLDGRRYPLEIVNRRRQRDAAPYVAQGVEDLTAPMPGTILKINVAPGDSFAVHQALIVMESMKMEMTLSSPRAGRVKEITCEVGELVRMGQSLAKLDFVVIL